MTEIEIGRGKRGRRAYAFDDIAVVPSRRTRDPEEVSIAWQIDAYRFELPLLAAPMDSVVSPATAIAVGDSAASACSTSKGCGPATRSREPLLDEIAELDEDERNRAAAGDLRRADQGGADRGADQGGARRGRHRRRRAVPAAHRAVLQGRRGRRGRHVRHPRHHRLGRARLRPGRAAEPQAVHLRTRRPGDRRRLRHLHGRTAPDAHRRGRRPRRLRRRRGAHHAATCWASRCRWPRRWPTSPRPAGTTWTSPAAGTCTSSPTAAWAAQRRHRQGDRLRRRRRDDRLAAGPRRPTRPARLPLGCEAHHSELPRGKRVDVGTVGTLEEILLGPSRHARRLDEPLRCAAPGDGHHRLLRRSRSSSASRSWSTPAEFSLRPKPRSS